MFDAGAFAGLISLEVPHRSPNSLDSLNHLIVRTQVRHRSVKAGPIEIWQILAVRRTAREDSLPRVFRMETAQHLSSQPLAHSPFLKVAAQPSEVLPPVRRIVNELLIVQHRVDCIVEFVSAQELIVVIKRNSETRRHGKPWQMRVNQLAKICRLCSVGNYRRGALLAKVSDLCDR